MTEPPSRASLIIGIGASAGGLAALKIFLDNTPADTGMAFIMVHHLNPEHPSMLVDLLAAHTPMPVARAEDGALVAANHVYVIPPNATLTIETGVLRVTSPAPAREMRRPIDTFFLSLAADQGARAASIVLAGVGSDCTRGLQAVKAHGGLTLAQAEFDETALRGMPMSVVATGLVDHVLPVEAMPAKLIEHQEHVDVGALKRAGQARQNLSASVDSVIEGSIQGIAIQQEGRILFANPAMARMFGYAEPEDMIGVSTFDSFVVEDERPILRQRTAAVYQGAKLTPHPGWRGLRKDGTEIWVSSMAHPIRWQGRPALASFYLDITDRKRAEERQKMLVRELDHRVKNTLALVETIVQRSRNGASTMDEYMEAIMGRVEALSQAHSAISQGDWQGASLATLVHQELNPHATGSNTTIEGPDIALNPLATQVLTLVLHELATNAAKYGALSPSAPNGRLTVRWQCSANVDPTRHLVIDWQESGGPPVAPDGKVRDLGGYGSSVIRGLIPHELPGSTVDLDLAPSGVCCRIEIPLAVAEASQN